MDEPATLEDLQHEWEGVQGEHINERWRWWTTLTGPRRRLFYACQQEVQVGRWSQSGQWWLRRLAAPNCLSFVPQTEEPDRHLRMARLHLRCVQVAIEHSATLSPELAPEATAALACLADEADVRAGFALDLTQELLQERSLRQAVNELKLRVLVVDNLKDRGVVVRLLLERLAGGNQKLYPHPDLAFIRRDAHFLEAEANARNCVVSLGLWPDHTDVRWHLTRTDGGHLPALEGNSAGAALALGLAPLLAKPV